jgi:hypothetical protein
MADDKRSRDKRAHDAEQRQRERELKAALERWDEPEPPIGTADLEIERELGDSRFRQRGTN